MPGKIGIIGGSGLYDIEGIRDVRKEKLETPFGNPSDCYTTGKLEGVEVVFLPRHGDGHTVLPSELNYRANIYGFKMLGVDQIISVSAVGSLRENMHPMDVVIPDQFVDRTNSARICTFFGDGIVAHISFANPVCPIISQVLYESASKLGVPVHKGGTYINMEGPAFSTKAESKLYRSWGMDIIGMTNMAEAKLAREAQICYATMALVTDYDCWHESHDHVTVDQIIEYLTKNVHNAKKILRPAIISLAQNTACSCRSALKNAILTNPAKIKPETYDKLKLLIGNYINK